MILLADSEGLGPSLSAYAWRHFLHAHGQTIKWRKIIVCFSVKETSNRTQRLNKAVQSQEE